MSPDDDAEPGEESLTPDLVSGEVVSGEAPATAGAGALGGLDLDALLSAAGEMQTQLAAAQQEAAEQEVQGVAGGGAVRITVTGGGEFRRVQIAPEAVEAAEVDLLCDLVLAALHDASAKVQELQASSMGGLGGLLGGGLGDLFGGPGSA